jgi:hypothetical protein
MPSSETVSKRRSISHQTRQAALRSKLFLHYRNDPRYQQLVANHLRPLWQTFEGGIRAQFGDAMRFHPQFGHLLAAVEGRPNSLLDPFGGVPAVDLTGQLIPPPGPPSREQLGELGLYVGAVLQHVRSPFGLTWKGKPAAWAVQFIHADVTKASGDPLNDPGVRLGDDNIDRASVQVTVGPGSVGRRIRLEWPHTPWVSVNQPGDVHWVDRERLAPGFSGEDWVRLEEKAHESLAEGIAELRAWYEAHSDRLNSTRRRDEADTLKHLYRHLHPPYPNKRPTDSPAVQKAIRRVATLIQIDVPTERSR